MREKEPEYRKIRVMARTLLEKTRMVESFSKELEFLRSGVSESGSDWHDTQALHGDIYISQGLMRMLGLPKGEIEIITPREEVDEIGIGNTIVLRNPEDNALEITIGGEYDLDPSAGIFSCNSPIAQQALGKKKGDTFKVSLSEKEELFEVIDIKKGEF